MRRVLAAFVFLVAFLAALAVGLVLVRTEVAELAIRQALKSEGITTASFDVASVGPKGARIENLRLGRFRSIAVGSIEVALEGVEGWNPLTWQPEIGEVRIDGLRLELDSRSDSGLLNDPELDRLVADPGTDDSVGEAPEIPLLRFTDAQVIYRAAEGDSSASLSGSLERPAGGTLAGLFSYRLDTPAGEAEGEVELRQAPAAPLTVELTAARARLTLAEAPVDSLTAGLTLTLAEDALPELTGQVTLSGIAPLAGYVQEMTLAVQADPTAVTLALEATATDGSRVGSGKLEATRLDGRPQVRGSVTLNAAEASARLGLTQAGGSLKVTSEVVGTLPPLVEVAAAEAPLAWIAETELRASLAVSADKLTIPGRALGVSADLQMRMALAEGGLELQVPKASRVAIAALDPEWSLLADLPEDTRRALWRGLTLAFGGDGEEVLRLRATQTAEGYGLLLQGPLTLTGSSGSRIAFAGKLATQLSPDYRPGVTEVHDLRFQIENLAVDGNLIDSLNLTGTLEASESGAEGDLTLTAALQEAGQDDLLLEQLDLALPLSVSGAAGAWRLALRESGSLSLAGASLEGAPLLREPLVLAVDKALLTRDSDGSWQQSLTAGTPRLRLDLPGDPSRVDLERVALELDGSLTEAEGFRGDLDLSVARLAVPGVGLRLSELKIRSPLPLARLSEESAKISVASTAVSAEGSDVGGMSLTAEVTRRGETYRLRGSGRGPNGRGRLTVSLDHDLARESGRMTAKLGPLTFAPDGLQPAALFAALEPLEAVSGSLNLEATAEWDGLSSNVAARLQLVDIGATLLPLTFEGLNTDLSFPGLDPLVTPRDQLLTISSLDVGVPLQDVLLTFQILDAEAGPTLDAERLQADFAGGRLLASPFRVSAKDEVLSSNLEIAHIKLDRLTELLDLGDIQLEGRLIGQLPLTVDMKSESFAIANGWLQAVDEGVIRIPDAAERLGLGDVSKEQPDLFFALEALADFRYSYLYATVSFSGSGELDLALTLEGNNPAVREGYPFKFNVTLGVNLSDLLAAFRLGQEITPALFDGGWSLK
ncbi:MAG: hypothetical protein Kilf2KO_00730 [Rhodospirillales bacterium]